MTDFIKINQTNINSNEISLKYSEVKVLFFSLIALLAIRISGMFLVPFTDTTEARYAEIARKMVETGDWITPQFAYNLPFWGKPPLHTWLSAFGMEVFGINEFGARIFIFFTTLLLLWFVFQWVKNLFGRDTALIVITTLASNGLFFGAAAFVSTDLPMTIGITISMIGFYNAISIINHKVWGYLFFIGMAIGLLAKGPVAVVLTGLPIFFWLLIYKRWSDMERLPWVSGIVLLILLVTPWYVLAEYKTPGFLNYFLIGEHFERFIISGWKGDLYGSSHSEPKGMIWLFWMLGLIPWTFAYIVLFRSRNKIVAAMCADQSGLRGYLLCWTIAPMIFFTPAANILPAYILPSLPAAVILLVIMWQDSFETSNIKKRIYEFVFTVWVMSFVFLFIVIFAAISPQTIGLKSQKHLIASVNKNTPDAHLSYWLKRHFSGDFYSFGKAKVLRNKASLEQLLKNKTPDFLAVQTSQINQISDLLKTHFIKVRKFGHTVLFRERFVERSKI